ncbi:MAG: hypothetical protein GX434_13295 [Peptococcaceae bacterium]|nr:hypothetical protein [Peptococcaceae bacterium]
MKPALVRFKGNTNEEIIHGKIYKAYSLDYWNNELKCLYIKDETGEISGWHDLDEFEVIEDKDNVISFS